MISFNKLILSLYVFALTVHSVATPLGHKTCGPSGVQVRLPNGMTGSFDADSAPPTHSPWILPPQDFYFKPWFMVYATHAANLALRNFQYDPSPIHPGYPGSQVNDLGSFQIPGSDTVFTTYGIDTPLSLANDIFWYVGTGLISNANSTYTMNAWGCDNNGLPFYVNYASASTATPAGIDIMSTTDTGMDDDTLATIRSKLIALGNAEIAAIAKNLTRTMQDGGRDGMPRITTCDDECKTNENLRPIFFPGGKSTRVV